MSFQRVDVIVGQSAHDLLCDGRFLAAWQSLRLRCPYATGFQSPAFVRAWYETYQSAFQPVVVRSMSENGELLGLWLLALDSAGKELVHAGGHQAEYHVWLALPQSSATFLESAWTELQKRLSFKTLRFKYLPAASLATVIRAVPGIENRCIVRLLSRPLLTLDAIQIKASFAKKSNRSRFNRLKKVGPLEFRRLTAINQLEQLFDEFIAFYDFRQGAVNHTRPFYEDPFKRKFCVAQFTASPQDTHVTVTYLGGRLIAALWGIVSAQTLHLGMLTYSPLLAEHSPGKLHIMQLSELLLREGKKVLDLTPGGDLWKERFANSHDDVAEVVLYRSKASRFWDYGFQRLVNMSRMCSIKLGVRSRDIRSFFNRFRRVRATAVMRKLKAWAYTQREFRVYRGDRLFAARFEVDARIVENSIADLLCFEPGESWQTKEAFLRSALERLEQGESVFSMSIDGRLAHSGWMVKNQAESFMTEVQQSVVFPQGSLALYDFYTHPDFRGRGLYRRAISHMLCKVAVEKEMQYVYISVLADNLASRHVIESLGFQYQGSLYLTRRWGMEFKWADSVFTDKEAASA